MALDPQARAHLAHVASLGLRPVNEMSVTEARESVESTADALFGAKDSLASIEDFEIGGPLGPIPVRFYRSGPDSDGGILLYFHGGGWVFGSLATHDGVCRALARRGDCSVLSVAYRLAPEDKFPAAVQDAWASLQWVFENHAHSGIAVGGDSAGGNLAAVIAIQARDLGLPIRLQLLVYPVTDCHMDTVSYRQFGSGYGLTSDEMEWFIQHYLDAPGDQENPKASPLLCSNLAGVAPALVITCEYDVLRDEGEAYAARLHSAGVPVRCSRYSGLIHGFYRMGAVLQRAKHALDESGEVLRTALQPKPTLDGSDAVRQLSTAKVVRIL